MSLSEAPAVSWRWKVRGRDFDLREKTLIMGVLNLTADSFSDGGRFMEPDAALAHGESLVEAGAHIIDLGAESTRPGRAAGAVSADDEWRRLEPVLTGLRARYPGTVLSVDTYRGVTAERALDAGADVINDIYALRHSPEIAGHCVRHGAGLLLMHMQGDPDSMQADPTYENILAEIRTALRLAMDVALDRGLAEEQIAVDPGIGFGKTVDHNVEILAGLEYLRLMQRPICVGASRKGFLGKLSGGLPVDEREEATLAAHCAAVLHGATIIRTHNVQAAVRSMSVIDSIRQKI